MTKLKIPTPEEAKEKLNNTFKPILEAMINQFNHKLSHWDGVSPVIVSKNSNNNVNTKFLAMIDESNWDYTIGKESFVDCVNEQHIYEVFKIVPKIKPSKINEWNPNYK